MAEALARTLDTPVRPTYRTDRSFEWNHANGPDFAGPWPAVPETPEKEFFGLAVRSRFGVPASILLNSRWIDTYARLGFDLLTYKTVRSVKRLCYDVPNWRFLDPATVARLDDQDAAQRVAPDMPDRPLDVTGVRTLAVGSILWLVAFIALLPFYSTLQDNGRGWWLWTCLAGFGLGLLGLAYCRRRRNRLAAEPEREVESSPLGAAGL